MALTAEPTWPGWRVLARWGVPVQVRVDIMFDADAGVYYVANSNLKGLRVEAESLDEMQREICAAASDLLETRFNGSPPKTDTKIIMHSAATCAA